MIRQCVKLKAQTLLNVAYLVKFMHCIDISLQKYFLLNIETKSKVWVTFETMLVSSHPSHDQYNILLALALGLGRLLLHHLLPLLQHLLASLVPSLGRFRLLFWFGFWNWCLLWCSFVIFDYLRFLKIYKLIL